MKRIRPTTERCQRLHIEDGIHCRGLLQTFSGDSGPKAGLVRGVHFNWRNFRGAEWATHIELSSLNPLLIGKLEITYGKIVCDCVPFDNVFGLRFVDVAGSITELHC